MTQPRLPSLIPRLDAPGPFMDAAKSLEDAGQRAVAAALLAEAERQFPADEALFWCRSEFIERNQGREAGFARWVMMTCRFPGRDRIWANVARHHRKSGRPDAAVPAPAQTLLAGAGA